MVAEVESSLSCSTAEYIGNETEEKNEHPICLKGITDYIEKMETQSADLEKRSRELLSKAESGGGDRLYTEVEEMTKKAEKDLKEVKEAEELCEKNMYPGLQKEASLAACGRNIETIKYCFEMLDEVKRILESD